MKSLNNLLLLGDGETWARQRVDFAGLPEMVRTFLQVAAGAADIPVTRLLGLDRQPRRAFAHGLERISRRTALIQSRYRRPVAIPVGIDMRGFGFGAFGRFVGWKDAGIGRLSLTVGQRVALITLVPILSLVAVFGLFTLCQQQVGAQIDANHLNLQTALRVKSLRDQIVTAQLSVNAFLLAPNDTSAKSVAATATAVGMNVTKLLDGTAGSPIATLPTSATKSLKAVTGDIATIVSAQQAVGYHSNEGLAGTANTTMQVLEATIRDNADLSDPLAAAVSQDYVGMLHGQVRFAMSHDPSDRAAFATSADAVRKDLEASFLSAEAKGKIGAALDTAVNGFAAWAEAIQQVADAQSKAATHLDRLSTGIDGVVAASSRAADAAEANLTAIQSRGATTVGATILAAIVLCCSLCFVIGRSISRPIRDLSRVMRRMTDGELDVALIPHRGRTEIAEMSRSVAAFREGALQNRRLEAEAARGRQAAEVARERRENEKAEEARDAQHVVQALGAGLGALSSGDLLTRIEVAFAAKSEQLRSDFNHAVDRLNDTMTEIGANTGTIQARSETIAAAALDLSRRTEKQAASVEHTAASLDEITRTVSSTADHAKHAHTAVANAKASAEASGGIVNRAIGAMTDIEGSSSQIGQIIGVIDEIAFQTNLLALNAGVEAARAGDAGRGFAVVASEVRALAQRSAEAAKQIKGLISASRRQVEAGVDLVGQAGKALDRIATEVADLNVAVSAIAASAIEQAQGLTQVNSAVAAIDQITKENAMMVEETTATVNALAGETDRLATLVGQFKTGSGRKNTPASVARAAPRRIRVAGGPSVMFEDEDLDAF